jgi:Fe-S cluster biosynthesis and repair protein YggX
MDHQKREIKLKPTQQEGAYTKITRANVQHHPNKKNDLQPKPERKDRKCYERSSHSAWMKKSTLQRALVEKRASIHLF